MKKELIAERFLDCRGFGYNALLYRLWKECPKYAFEMYKKYRRANRFRLNGKIEKLKAKNMATKFNEIVSSWYLGPYEIGERVYLTGHEWYDISNSGLGVITEIDSDDYVAIDWLVRPANKITWNRRLFHAPTELRAQKIY